MRIKEIIDALGKVGCPAEKARSRINYWIGMGLLHPTGGKGATSPREFSADDRACAIILSLVTDYGQMGPDVLKPAMDCLRESGFERMAAGILKGDPLALYVTIFENTELKLRVIAEVGIVPQHEPPEGCEEVFSFRVPLYRIAREMYH